MKKLIFTICMLLFIIIVPLEINAQWVQVNIGTVNVSTLKSDGNLLLAGTNSGFYLSSDNGATWNQRNNGLTNLGIRDLAVSGTNYIVATDSGEYLSSDQGANWNFFGITPFPLHNFAVIGSTIMASSGPSVFRSTNFGNNWSLEHFFLLFNAYGEPSNITCIEAIGSTFHLGSYDGGAVLSTDYGSNWVWDGGGLPNHYPLSLPTVYGFASIGNNLYLGASGFTFNGIYTGGLYHRDINATGWSLLSNNLYMSITCLGSESDKLFVGASGFLMTTNNGLNWINKSQGLNPSGNIYSILNKDDLIFIINNGRIWKRNKAEMYSYQPNDIGAVKVSNPQNNGNYYVDCDSGVYIYPGTTIENFGSNNQITPFEVFIEIKYGTNTVYLNSKFDTISAGGSHDVIFDPYFVPENAVGEFKIKSWTKLLSDSNEYNDTSWSVFNVFNPNYSVTPNVLSGGYEFANSTTGAGCAPDQPVFYWEDTTGSISLISNGIPQIPLFEGDIDNGVFLIDNIFPSGINFRFFSDVFNDFKISTNGIIGMGENSVGITDPDPKPVPELSTMVVPAFFAFWCDLDFSDPDVMGRNLKYKVNNDRLIITYDRVPVKNPLQDSEDYLSFQIILEPNPTSNGILTVQFDNTKTGSTFLNKYYSNTLNAHTIGLQEYDYRINRGIQYRHQNSAGVVTTNGPLFSSPLAVSFGSDNSVLPAELLSFTSSVNENNVNLIWQTNKELNNSGFDIERSAIDDQWIKAGFIPGNGNSNVPKEYSFTDKNLAPGKYKYRLKQIDFNGSFEYYSLAGEVSIGIPDKYELSQNYPNPFNPSTVIRYSLTENSFTTLKIYDITGREMTRLVNEKQEAGRYEVIFNGSNLASGVYFYELRSGDFVAQKKMVILK
ncbi:MAG TPA: T9SS type A sorting domain-containing protein [Ignavibacteria bacterium]|nr:T9SS type A sorting domain-containing protein [Ignavibacteria bacterium]